MFSGRLREAHIYGKEEAGTTRSKTSQPLDPALERLLAAGLRLVDCKASGQ